MKEVKIILTEKVSGGTGVRLEISEATSFQEVREMIGYLEKHYSQLKKEIGNHYQASRFKSAISPPIKKKKIGWLK